MPMKRAALLIGVGVAALACCAQAVALGRADATVSASITTQRAGVEIISPLVLPTIIATAISPTARFAGSAPSTGASGAATPSGAPVGAAPVGNAALTISGQAGDTVSTAVPESFQVTRTGGTEALTVRTNTNAEFGATSDGALAGTVMNGNTMSVNVGGSISLASAGALVPGPYEGLLVVVVQYN